MDILFKYYLNGRCWSTNVIHNQKTAKTFGTFAKTFYLCSRMKTKGEYIELIKAHTSELQTMFGIRSLRLFGSVSRGEHHEGSDVDVCVEMEPQAYLIVRLKRFLEHLLECSVDIVRMHKHMNPFLLEEINRDGIYIIQ